VEQNYQIATYPKSKLGLLKEVKTIDMRKIIYVLMVLGLLGAAYGYYEWNRPVASVVNKKAEHTISAIDLEAAYSIDEAAANTKYNDKLVQVNGSVEKVETDGGKTSIYLKTNNPISAIICEMENGSETSNIKEGESVSIKGRPTGILTDVIMVGCVLTK
jgi:tRNA_anti-like